MLKKKNNPSSRNFTGAFFMVFLYIHNLESQNAGLVDVKKDLNLKNQREFCARKSKI